MTLRNWGSIPSGATFEALAQVLVGFEDPTASLFGRPGKDGGQDARSGDGTRVYQAKFHQDGSPAQAIADAAKEAAKIAKYRTVGHQREPQWRGVTHWHLLTNVAFNPTDIATWDATVIPAFAALNLVVDYWSRTELDARLIKHPEVDRAFFGGEPRMFLTLPELGPVLERTAPFLPRAEAVALQGRRTELAQIDRFLASSELFLIAHGAGGVGKTRLLFEAGMEIAGQGAWQVLWANVASTKHGRWLEGLVPERNTLLLVDEPEDATFLQALAEQLATSRMSKWKVAVIVRSPKDPVLKYLAGPKIRRHTSQLEVSPLPNDDAVALCTALMTDGRLATMPPDWKQTAAEKLAKAFHRFPIWLTLAVHLLEEHGDLAGVPETSEELASLYVSEVVLQQSDYPSAVVQSMLNWVALIGTVNCEDTAVIELLRERLGFASPTDVHQALERLVGRKALSRRGARGRLVEVKPDVIRDHLLQTWLTARVGGDRRVPSGEAEALVDEAFAALLAGSLNASGRAALRSLARTDALLRASGVEAGLIDRLFCGLTAGLPRTTASIRVTIIDVLTDVGAASPAQAAAFSSWLRTNPASTETIPTLFRATEVTQEDIILDLPWMVFNAAMGADSETERRAIVDELGELLLLEEQLAERRLLPNDGKRAAALLGRLLEGGPQFWTEFEDEVGALGLRLLDSLATGAPSPAECRAARAALKPAVAVERHQTLFEDNSFTLRRYAILPGHPGWDARSKLLDRMRQLLTTETTPKVSRLILWEVFAEAHRSLHHAASDIHRREELEAERLQDLKWVLATLTNRATDVDELIAARDVWDWHRRYDTNVARKTIATQLEDLYGANTLAEEFGPLTDFHDDHESLEKRVEAKAVKLAAGPTPEVVTGFLDRAVAYLGPSKLGHLNGLAASLGVLAPAARPLQEALRLELRGPLSPRFDLAAQAVTFWMVTARKADSGTALALMSSLLDETAGEAQRARLAANVYARPWIDITDSEVRALRAMATLFLANGYSPAFFATIGSTFMFEWDGFKACADAALKATDTAQLGTALRALVDSIDTRMRRATENDVQPGWPPDLTTWLLEQLIRVGDPGGAGEMLHWHLERVIDRAGKATVFWFAQAIGGNAITWTSLSRHRLTAYVGALDANAAQSSDTMAAVEALVDLHATRGHVGYVLPKYLADIDPEGLLVPKATIARLSLLTGTSDVDKVVELTRLANGYPLNSPPWRVIAMRAVRIASSRKSEEEVRRIFGSLLGEGIRSWSAPVGQVSEQFRARVQEVVSFIAHENEAELRQFWQWLLEGRTAELNAEQERVKEDRDE